MPCSSDRYHTFSLYLSRSSSTKDSLANTQSRAVSTALSFPVTLEAETETRLGTYRHADGHNKTYRRPDDFAMTRVLVRSTLKANDWYGDAIHAWRREAAEGGSEWKALAIRGTLQCGIDNKSCLEIDVTLKWQGLMTSMIEAYDD